MMSAISCMALAVYFEARNQPLAGQLAVAHVISNRVASGRYPNTPCEVIMQGPTYASGHPRKHRCQFSFWCDGKSEAIYDYEAWRTAVRVATVIQDTSSHRLDISEGATHYHTTEVSPPWRYTMKVTVKIGSHIFYKP